MVARLVSTRRRAGFRAFLCLATACLGLRAFADDEGAWRFEGQVAGYKDDQRTVVIFVLPDRSRIEVPVTALTEDCRAKLPKEEPATDQSGIVLRGPLGLSVSVPISSALKAVETDAIWCRTAAEGLRVYDLFLAGSALTNVERVEAESRRQVWADREAQGRVRMGDAWVTKQEFEVASAEAKSLVQSAIHSFQLEDYKRGEAELEKAARRNPEDGTAEFVLGIAYWLNDNMSPKAVEHFNAASRRIPDDPYVLNNLLVCDMQAGRFGGVVDRFTRLINLAPTCQPIADNLGLTVFGSGARKQRIPDRLVDRLLDIYRKACQDLKLVPIEAATGRKFEILSPYGRVCKPGPPSTLHLLLEPPREWVVCARYGTAVSIGGNLFLTNRSLLADSAEVFLQVSDDVSKRLPATELAWLDDCDVSLVKCEELAGRVGLSLAEKHGTPGQDIVVLSMEEGAISSSKPLVAAGRIVDAPRGVGAGLFFHSAVLPRGVGGGGIVDASGRLLGLTASTPRTEQSGNVRGCGIPIEKIWPLLKEHAIDIKVAGEAVATPDRGTLEAKIGHETVRVMVLVKQSKPK